MRRFSKTWASCMIVVILFGMMKNNLLYLLYKYDTPLFIELFCINQNNPLLNCDGKCQISIMLKEEQDQHAADQLKVLQAEVLYFFHGPIVAPEKPTYIQIEILTPVWEPSSYSFIFTSRNDRPPEYIFS